MFECIIVVTTSDVNLNSELSWSINLGSVIVMASAPKKIKRSHYSNNTSMNNHKKSNYREESDNTSSSSSDSEIFGSHIFRKQHYVNKRRKKSYALRRIRYNRIIDNDSSSDDLNMIDSLATSSPKKRNQQLAVPNFKPCINKVIEEFKQIFLKFTLQLNKLQVEYLKDEIITEDTAENITFIISCVISKMKEELTNHQQKLNNAYFQQSMKNNCKIIVSNSQSRSSDTEDLQAQTKSSSGSNSTYNKIISTHRPKTSLTSSENSRHNSDFLKSKNTTPSRLDTRNNKEESSSKKNSSFTIKAHNNNSLSNNLKDAKLVLYKLKDIHAIKKSAKDPVTESNVLNLEVLKSKLNETKKNLPLIEKDLYTNNFAEEKGDDSSDVDSTCSTVALGYSRKKSMQEDDKFKDLSNTDIHRYINRSRSPSVELSTSLVQLDDTIQFYNSDTDESSIIVVPNKNVDHSETTKATSPFSEVSQLIAKYPSVSIVRSNSTRKSTRNENKIDRKLIMDCRVLVEKLVLPNVGKTKNK